jgi:hypothetical protein
MSLGHLAHDSDIPVGAPENKGAHFGAPSPPACYIHAETRTHECGRTPHVHDRGRACLGTVGNAWPKPRPSVRELREVFSGSMTASRCIARVGPGVWLVAVVLSCDGTAHLSSDARGAPSGAGGGAAGATASAGTDGGAPDVPVDVPAEADVAPDLLTPDSIEGDVLPDADAAPPSPYGPSPPPSDGGVCIAGPRAGSGICGLAPMGQLVTQTMTLPDEPSPLALAGGKLIDGTYVMTAWRFTGTPSSQASKTIRISNCGETLEQYSDERSLTGYPMVIGGAVTYRFPTIWVVDVCADAGTTVFKNWYWEMNGDTLRLTWTIGGFHALWTLETYTRI